MRILVALVFLSSSLYAKDFGVYGHIQPILEEDLLDYIKRQLIERFRDGSIQNLQQGLKKRALKSINRPKPVSNLKRARTFRRYTYDPSFKLSKDIKDPMGRLIYKKDTLINPLKIRPFKQRWYFVEGESGFHMWWALKDAKAHPKTPHKIILVNGAVFELSKFYKKHLYFDQMGVLTKKFKIQNMPAVLYQGEGDLITIEEHVVNK